MAKRQRVNFGGKKGNDTKGNPGKSVPLFRAENDRREAECLGTAIEVGAQAGGAKWAYE